MDCFVKFIGYVRAGSAAFSQFHQQSDAQTLAFFHYSFSLCPTFLTHLNGRDSFHLAHLTAADAALPGITVPNEFHEAAAAVLVGINRYWPAVFAVVTDKFKHKAFILSVGLAMMRPIFCCAAVPFPFRNKIS